MPTLTKYQDHYDACVSQRLPLECEWFIKNQTGKHPISRELKGEDGYTLLVEPAITCGYMLGMKPYLINDELSIQPKNVGWRFESTTKIPWGDKEKAKRNKELGKRGQNPAKIIDTSKMISGFGIELNLVGWKIFVDMRYVDLVPLIEQGMTIEDIFRLHKTKLLKARFLVFNGKSYPTTQALRMANIPRRSFDWKINKIADELGLKKQYVPDEDRQKAFDALLPRFNRGVERFGCLFINGKSFIKLSNDDLSIVLQNSRAENKAPDEWLHDILQSYSYQ